MIDEALKYIADWLNNYKPGKDFDKGLVLLDCYGSDKSIVTNLERSRYSPDLFKHLKALFLHYKELKQREEFKEVKTEAVREAAESQPDTKKKAEKLLIEDLYAKRKELYKKAGAWQAQLRYIGRDENGKRLPLSELDKQKRHKLALLIDEAMSEATTIWLDTMHYEIHGKLPVREKPKRKVKTAFTYLDKENTRKKIGTAKKTIEDLKQKTASLSGHALIKHNARLDKWVNSLAELEILYAKMKSDEAKQNS
jgi:hypothetical protein